MLPFVAQTSDWARQEEEEEEGNEVEDGGFDLEAPAPEEAAGSGLEEWEGDEEQAAEGEIAAEADGGFVEGEEEEEPYSEPPEEAKLFVGNLPYDMDSEKLAQLFDKAGVVEVAEVNKLSF